MQIRKQDVINYLEEAWENLLRNGMVANFYANGDSWVRQQGSFDGGVIYKIELGWDNFSDSYVMDGNEKDENMKDDFIADFYSDMKNELAKHEIELV